MSLFKGFLSLHRSRTNKVGDETAPDDTEGVISPLLPELELNMQDADLVSLANKWEGAYKAGSAGLDKDRTDAENYWLGKQKAARNEEGRALVDNRIFSSQETFLPIATGKNPEANAICFDPSPAGKMLADEVRRMLNFESDRQALKLKVRSAARNWGLYFVGVLKVGWDLREDNIVTSAVNPKRLVLDPNGTIDESGVYSGEFIGEHRRDSAQTLVDRFGGKADFVNDLVQGKMGTMLQYQEWWTNDYTFWKLGPEILGKTKNPHWNYDGEEERVDEMGNKTMVPSRGRNHFAYPRAPYVFLSVFNLGKHPWDDTSLIKQNLALQDLVNKRMAQIDKNVDEQNGGWVVSGAESGLSEDQAQLAINKARRGGGFYITKGDSQKAVTRTQAQALPADVYNSLVDARNEIDNVFGTHATTRGERTGTETATGRLTLKEGDTSRIGNPTDYIEQVTDQVFNWWLQLMYVYYTEPKVAAALGTEGATQFSAIRSADLNRKILVSVKEGSLLPQDPLNKRNEAVDLWAKNAIDPITLYDRLEFPNPREMAKNLFLWQNNPASLFPELAPPAPPPAVPGTEPAPEALPAAAPVT